MKYNMRVLLTIVCWLGITIPAWANNNEALLELLKALERAKSEIEDERIEAQTLLDLVREELARLS